MNVTRTDRRPRWVFVVPAYIGILNLVGALLADDSSWRTGLLVVQLGVLMIVPFVLVREIRRAKAAGEYEPPDVRGAFRFKVVRSDLLRVFRR